MKAFIVGQDVLEREDAEPKPRGFGSRFWTERLRVAQNRLSADSHPDYGYTEGELRAAFERVLEELIAQTRLDEALMCSRAIAPALGLDARILSHRRDLRNARRKK